MFDQHHSAGGWAAGLVDCLTAACWLLLPGAGCWTAGLELLGCWTGGLLNCCMLAAGLPSAGCWLLVLVLLPGVGAAAGVECWLLLLPGAGCWATGLLAAGLVGCFAAELLDCWTAELLHASCCCLVLIAGLLGWCSWAGAPGVGWLDAATNMHAISPSMTFLCVCMYVCMCPRCCLLTSWLAGWVVFEFFKFSILSSKISDLSNLNLNFISYLLSTILLHTYTNQSLYSRTSPLGE